MKKVLSLIIVLVLVLSLFAGCGGAKDVSIVENKKTLYSVIYGSENAPGMEPLASQFAVEFSERAGVTVYAFDDVTMQDTPKEIIIGNTNRAETAALKAEMDARPAAGYGIKVVGEKLVVLGTDISQTYLALEYLMDNLLKVENGVASLVLASDFSFFSVGEDIFFDVQDLVDNHGGAEAYITKVLAQVPTIDDKYRTMQGGCTDGTYAYIAMIDGKVTPQVSVVHKYDLSTWELVATSEELATEHTNDMTYNPNSGRIYIHNCAGSSVTVSIMDPETLKITRTIQVPEATRAIDYIPELDQYVIGGNYKIYMLDNNFKLLSSYDSLSFGVTQGLCADGKYMYDARWNMDLEEYEESEILVYDHAGNLVERVRMFGRHSAEYECEHIFRYGADFAVGYNGPDDIAKVELVPKFWWDVIEAE